MLEERAYSVENQVVGRILGWPLGKVPVFFWHLGFGENRLFNSSVNEAKEKGEQPKASPRSKPAHLSLKGGQNMEEPG